MSIHSPFLFVAILSTIIIFITSVAVPSSSSSFTLQPLHIQNSFALQSLASHSKYPFLTPNGHIFLTQDPSDSGLYQNLYNVGRITYNLPLRFKDDANQIFSFTSSFSFNITTFTEYNKSGDGVAFIVTTDRAPPQNSTGRFLGMMPEKPADRHERLMAVEFDTFQNLQAEIMDPSASHIGIDICNLSSIKPILNTADPSHPLYLYNNYTITAWVSYDASTHLIQVWATNSSDQGRPTDPILSTTQNLSQIFENYADIYVGITAASGKNSQASILYSWNFTIMDNERPNPSSYHVLIIVTVSAVAVLAVVTIVGIHIILPRKKLAVHEHNRGAAVTCMQP